MNKLIVGCGYLGRRVAAAWLAAGHSVAALTRSPQHAEELSRLGIQAVQGDICDPGSLVLLPAADTVLFSVGFDRMSNRSQDEVYVDGLRNVLTTVSQKCHRFLYVSSSSVYGQTEGEWVDENSECHPVQLGGTYCLKAERLVHQFFRSGAGESGHRASASVLRLSGIYGPDRLLSRIEGLRAGEAISGRADAWLNLIHVQDAVSAVIACDERGEAAQAYLVSDDCPVRRGEYYTTLARLVDAPPPVFNESAAPKRGAGGLNKRCSNRRLRNELGVELQFPSITEGLPDALRGSTVPNPSASRPPIE